MDNQEKRFLSSDFEVRKKDGKTIVEGYAARFEDETVIGGKFAERVARGAFDKADMANTVALFNHDWNQPLARAGKGLHLQVDEVGLKYRFELGDQSYAKDLAENIRTGNVSTSSFGFTVADDSWERRDNGVHLRTINEVETLFDVSPTTQGAYPTTEVGLRSLEAAMDREVEDELRKLEEEEEEMKMEEEEEEKPEERPGHYEDEEEKMEEEEEEKSEEDDDKEEKFMTEDAPRPPKEDEKEEKEEDKEDEPEARKTNNLNMKDSGNAAPAVIQGLGNQAEARAAKDFNFGKFIKEAAKGQLTGLEAEMSQEGANEMRNAGISVAGGVNLPEALVRSLGTATVSSGATTFGGAIGKDDQGIVENYAPNDIATRLGVRNLSNLNGDVQMQVQSTLTAAGATGEGVARTEGLPAFAAVTLSPTRYAAHVGVTQQMLAQSGDDMEAFIKMDIRRALDKQFNDAIIDVIDDAVAAANSTAYTAGSTSPLDLEENLLANDVSLDDIVALCDPQAYRKARTLSLDAGSGLLYAGSPAGSFGVGGQNNPRSSILGYNTVIASQVGGSGNDTSAGDLFMFDKNQLVTAGWGGMNLIVDPYTDAAKGVVRIIANEYKDVKSLQGAGFARMTGL